MPNSWKPEVQTAGDGDAWTGSVTSRFAGPPSRILASSRLTKSPTDDERSRSPQASHLLLRLRLVPLQRDGRVRL